MVRALSDCASNRRKENEAMTRQEYMNANKLTDGAYDGSKGHDVHSAYFAQFVNQTVTNTVLDRIGKERLLASRDVHLNDVPLKLWDDLPMTRHIEEKAREFGDNTSLSTKVCVYKTAARLWLKANGGLPLWRVRYEWPRMAGDSEHKLYSYAVGSDPRDALQNWQIMNSGTCCFEIVDNGGTPLNKKVKP
jgi:hypothetical protein